MDSLLSPHTWITPERVEKIIKRRRGITAWLRRTVALTTLEPLSEKQSFSASSEP
jgi:hypothetical protein